MRIALAALLLFFLTGCSALVPTEHKEQVAVQTAGTVETSHNDEVTKRSALSPVRIGGIGNRLEIKVPESVITTKSAASSDAEGKDSAHGFSFSKQPLWFKLLATALAIAIAILVWRWVKLEFPGVAAVASTVDSGSLAAINYLKTKAMGTTDPTKLAEINADIAHITAQSQTPPK